MKQHSHLWSLSVFVHCIVCILDQNPNLPLFALDLHTDGIQNYAQFSLVFRILLQNRLKVFPTSSLHNGYCCEAGYIPPSGCLFVFCNAVDAMYSTICDCQLLHPDANDLSEGIYNTDSV